MSDSIYIVSIDTRGMRSSDIEGYEEITCSRDYFENEVLNKPNLVCVGSHVADLCGLKKGFKLYFFERVDPKGKKCQVELASWSDFFPGQQNNPGATLLTFNPETGFADHNVQGLAYVLYDNGSYPLSKEQVWGIQQIANETKDLFHYDEEGDKRGRRELHRWCAMYRKRQWGSPYIYEPRKVEKPHRYGQRVCFSETCLI